jgi:hypothetical protein
MCQALYNDISYCNNIIIIYMVRFEEWQLYKKNMHFWQSRTLVFSGAGKGWNPQPHRQSQKQLIDIIIYSRPIDSFALFQESR